MKNPIPIRAANAGAWAVVTAEDQRSSAISTPETAAPSGAFSVTGGWGAWMRNAWEPEAPACVRCDVPMKLNAGCEWSDLPELNLCRSCAIGVLEDMRPNK